MAGKKEDPKDDQIVTGPENLEDSLADDFKEGPGIKLTGHPAMGEEEAGPSGPEGETPEVKEAREKAEAETAKPPEFSPKHKTWEETEKSRVEAEREMHEAKTLAATERAARETAEAKLAEKEAAKTPEKPVEEVKPPSREEQKTRLRSVASVANQKALDKIDTLDSTDPDYRKQVAEAWAEANTEALMEAGVGGVSQESINKMVTEQVQVTLKAEREATAAERVKEDERRKLSAEERTRQDAIDLAKGAGLDMTPGSADYRLFFDIAEKDLSNQEFMKGTTAPELKTQVEWVVGEYRKLTGKLAQTVQEREEAARKHQDDNTVLGKGGTKTTKIKQEGPGSLGSDFQEVRRERTLS